MAYILFGIVTGLSAVFVLKLTQQIRINRIIRRRLQQKPQATRAVRL